MSYETVTIQGYGWEAKIAPAYGANPISLQYCGEDILVPWSEESTDPFLIGAPLLLPANRTAGGKFSFAGKEYRLPVNDSFQCANLHGSLYHRHFRVLEQSGNSAELYYENTGETFPFPFAIGVIYRANKTGFFSEYTIENLGNTAMPLSFGLHTTFREPDWFSVPLESCQEKDSHHIPTGQYIPLNDQEQKYCTGSESHGLVISGFYRAAGDTACVGRDLRYQVTGFDHWILYNGRGNGGFLCIEPQLGGVNVLNNSKHCPILRTREVLRLKTQLYFTSDTAQRE